MDRAKALETLSNFMDSVDHRGWTVYQKWHILENAKNIKDDDDLYAYVDWFVDINKDLLTPTEPLELDNDTGDRLDACEVEYKIVKLFPLFKDKYNSAMLCSIAQQVHALKLAGLRKNQKSKRTSNERIVKLQNALHKLNEALSDIDGDFDVRGLLHDRLVELEFELVTDEVIDDGIETIYSEEVIEVDWRVIVDKYGEDWKPKDICAELTDKQINSLIQEANHRAVLNLRDFERYAGSFAKIVQQINPSVVKGRGRKKDIPLINFIWNVARIIEEGFGGEFKISGAERSRFKRLITILLPQADVYLEDETIEKRIKEVIRDTGVGKHPKTP